MKCQVTIFFKTFYIVALTFPKQLQITANTMLLRAKFKCR